MGLRFSAEAQVASDQPNGFSLLEADRHPEHEPPVAARYKAHMEPVGLDSFPAVGFEDGTDYSPER